MLNLLNEDLCREQGNASLDPQAQWGALPLGLPWAVFIQTFQFPLDRPYMLTYSNLAESLSVECKQHL